MHYRIGVVVLLLSVLSSIAVSGQTSSNTSSIAVPPLTKFSGTIPGAQGTIGVTFALYKEQTGGAPLWQETQNITVDAAGRYTAFLGANQSSGLPMELFASGEARWLGVQPEGQPEQPRSFLVSVPYALEAGDAQTLGGQPLSAFVLNPAYAGGTAAAASAVNSTQNYVNTGTTPDLTISGTPNYVAKFNSSGTNVIDSLIFDTGTAIGVGTSSPAAMLNVVAGAPPAAFVDVYSNSLTASSLVSRAARGSIASPTPVQPDDILGGLEARGFGATRFSAGQGELLFRASQPWTDTAHGTYLQMWTTANGTTSLLERLRIDDAGRVGIGTTAPGSTLEVNGDVALTNGSNGVLVFADGTQQATAAYTSNYQAPGSYGDNTFVGVKAGNMTLGTGGGPPNYASANVGVGMATLSSLTTGYNNTALGAFALRSNTTGFQNEAVGPSTLTKNTIGYSNTAVGSQAMFSNTTGYQNAAVGDGAMFSNTTGIQNAAVGDSALEFNTTGINNTAMGQGSLSLNSVGSRNSALGEDALHNNLSGSDNTASGFSALVNNVTGVFNTAVGAYALVASTASLNTAVGASALAANTTAAQNTAVGAQALVAATTAPNNTAAGYYAMGNLTTGFGFNTAVGSYALSASTTAYYNTAIGNGALDQNTTGNSNVAIGLQAGTTAVVNNANTTGSQNTWVGFRAGPGTSQQLTNATAIGYQTVNTASNQVALGNSAVVQVLLGGRCSIYIGAGNPNGAQTGNPCDLYLNTAGGASTTLFVKESGSGTTSGWVGK